MKKLYLILIVVFLGACATVDPTDSDADANKALNFALLAQADDIKARYSARRPAETLEFLGIRPGMTVLEALPGSGWYTHILATYLGQNGVLVGADYSIQIYELFGRYNAQQLEEKKTWAIDWAVKTADWHAEQANEASTPFDNGYAKIAAFAFGALPESMHGSADSVLFIRALHHLFRYESQGEHLTTALQNTFDVLKPGGTVGIVQHQARESMPDAWAGGKNGYIKKSAVIARFTQAGFELVNESDMHKNDKDHPTAKETVWRLGPSFRTSRDDPEKQKVLAAIGESNRMTLVFRKPKP